MHRVEDNYFLIYLVSCLVVNLLAAVRWTVNSMIDQGRKFSGALGLATLGVGSGYYGREAGREAGFTVHAHTQSPLPPWSLSLLGCLLPE